MRLLTTIAALLVCAVCAHAQPSAKPPARQTVDVLKYTVDRDGEDLGTHLVEIRRSGTETTVNIETRIKVKRAFITVYWFEYTAAEHYAGGKLTHLTATTDDFGTIRKLAITAKGGQLVVEVDGKSSTMDGNLLPASLWNAALLRQTAAIDSQKGVLLKLAVTDGGMDTVTVGGRPTKAHRYTLKSTPSTDPSKPFSQDAWFDDKGNIVQARFAAPDNSIISYHLTP